MAASTFLDAKVVEWHDGERPRPTVPEVNIDNLRPLPSIGELRDLERAAITTLAEITTSDHADDEDRVYAAATLLEHVRDRYDAWSSE